MRSAAKPPSKCSMSICFPSLLRSWRCSDESCFLIARRSPAFSPPLIRPPSRHCEPSFERILFPDLSCRKGHREEVCGIDKELIGWTSMWMGHGLQCASERYHTPRTFLLLTDSLRLSAPQDTCGANAA